MTAIYSKLLLILTFSTFLSSIEPTKVSRHPLHVSTTEIDFNVKEKSLEVSCRIFTDDFEDVLAKQFKVKTDLSKQAVHQQMDELVKKYLAAHLQFKVNGKVYTASYVGFEKDNEATNVYLEIPNITSLQNLNLTNSILYDLYEDQMNILHVEKAGTRKSVRANYPTKELGVVF